MRQKFDQQWSVRKTESTELEQSRVLTLVEAANVNLEMRLQGGAIPVEELMNLKEGDVLSFDYSVEQPLECLVNGKLKFQGQIVSKGSKKAFLIDTATS